MSKPESWKSWEGRTVEGKFPLRQWLGGSDHSAVFLTAVAGAPTQKAAIKFIAAEGGDADRQLSRLQTAAKLSHPHLIRTFERGRCQMDGAAFVYVVMECADDDLSQVLPQRPLDAAEVAEMIPPLLEGLAYVHSSGFVHSRIKPSNVLAVGDQLKLSSDNIDSAAQPKLPRRRIDSYDAPETAAGIALPESDVWSLGALLVAAFTQNVSLEDGGGQREPGLPGGIPDPFRGIVRECLHLDPKRRCSLKEIQARLQPSARSVPAPPEPPAQVRTTTRRPAFALTLLGVAVVGIVLAVMYFRDHKSSTQPPEPTQQPSTQAAPAPAQLAQKPTQPARKALAPAPVGEVLHQVLPDPPKSAMNTITGTIKVTVRVQVDASGKVTEAKFKSSGSSPYFAGQALKAAERWEFTPPEVDGQPAASTWLLQFRFKRSGIQASSQPAKR
ncbi:MAG TPA: TonB family protein [Candidatus Dormibacteraeota bacterium]|nr:TonB family protein [Candidatus Dormibacteraeota bacterium]